MRPRQEPDGRLDGFDRLEIRPRRRFGLPADDPPVFGIGPAQPLEKRGRLGSPSAGRVEHEAAVIAERPDNAETGKDREVHAAVGVERLCGLDQRRVRLSLQLVDPHQRRDPPGVPMLGPSACIGLPARAARPSTADVTGSDRISPGSAGPRPGSRATTTARRPAGRFGFALAGNTDSAHVSPAACRFSLRRSRLTSSCLDGSLRPRARIARPRPAQENALRSRHRRAAIESTSSDPRRWRATTAAGLPHGTGPRRDTPDRAVRSECPDPSLDLARSGL